MEKDAAEDNLPFALQHWHWQLDQEQVLWLGLDVQGEKNNVFKQAVLDELTKITDYLYEHTPQAVIVYSKKKAGFIAGADVKEFSQIKTVIAAEDFVSKVQRLFLRWAGLPCVTVAMIEGFCLGGGMEFALACRYRVADNGGQTKLGLPEVKLGIIPGWGGTVRLPRLLGVRRAMPLLLTGKLLSARAAARIGLVNAAVSQAQLKTAALYYACSATLPKKARARLSKKLPFIDRMLTWMPWRWLIASMLRAKLRAKVSAKHYPAPYAIVDNWSRYGAKGNHAFMAEAAAIAGLVCHPTSRHLVRVFFLQQQLKSIAKIKKNKIQHVHVIGAGVMGGDIAAWCALQGLTVTMQDISLERMQPACGRAYALFKKRLRQSYLQQRARDRLIPDAQGHGIASADLIIEAIIEDLSAKHELLTLVEERCKADAILATNTSSLELDQINQVLKQPERLVGIHFFNPVAKLPLVEVVAGDKTSPDVVALATSFVTRIKKLPLITKSKPGFLVNRTLMPYLLEAVTMLEEGYAPEMIDKAAVSWGMPMGPIALADSVGLDICLSVAKNLAAAFGGQVPAILTKQVTAEHLGVKSGAGFYIYPGRAGRRFAKRAVHPTVAELAGGMDAQGQQDIADRLRMRMLNECVSCLGEKIVASANELDAGLIFGCGFPPFSGGAMCMIKDEGVEACLARLNELKDRYGDRFQPHAAWHDKQLLDLK